MTKIGKPITRETTIQDRGRPLVVALHPKYLVMRRKGTSEVYTIGYDAVWSLAAKQSSIYANGGK